MAEKREFTYGAMSANQAIFEGCSKLYTIKFPYIIWILVSIVTPQMLYQSWEHTTNSYRIMLC